VFSPERRSESLRERWSVSDKRPAILYAGRLSREKGLPMLEQIGSILYRRHWAHRFVIAGDGPMSDELRQAIPDAVFTGRLPQDQLAVAMASSDVFVFPSDTDTAGNAVLEAQASGVPAIVSAAGGPKENMVDGETGLVCRPGDPLAFAAGIEQLLVDCGRRRKMGTDARRFAAARSWETSMTALFAAYRATIVAAKAGPSSAQATGRQPLVSARLRR
jgi:glycosyltransferase involved in cell wall biosynthesis